MALVRVMEEGGVVRLVEEMMGRQREELEGRLREVVRREMVMLEEERGMRGGQASTAGQGNALDAHHQATAKLIEVR